MIRVLVAVDESKESNIALRYACHMLENHPSARLDALHVRREDDTIPPESFYSPFVDREDIKKWAQIQAEEIREQTEATCETCSETRVPYWTRVVSGDPAEEILSSAHIGAYDMVVLGSHGRSALRGLLLGTVHSKVLHHVRQPVLIVRTFRPIRRVLVAYRGSQCDQGALEFISPLLAARKPDMTILYVEETGRKESGELCRECLLQGERTLKQFNHQPVTKAAKGEFVDEILKEASSGDYDLIVMGAYGRNRPKFLQVISDEALNLVRSTTIPVLVYRDINEKN